MFLEHQIGILELCLKDHVCHGAHSREEQGHADEDVNSNSSL